MNEKVLKKYSLCFSSKLSSLSLMEYLFLTGLIFNTVLASTPNASIMPYRLWYKNLLFSWKSQDERSLSLIFAKACLIKIRSVLGKSSLENWKIVPVPPRPGKIRMKGWDQVDELCSVLSVISGIRVYKLLERTSGQQQKKLERTKRLEKGRNPYVLSASGRKLSETGLENRNFLLVDDIFTTGATMERCSSVLKKYFPGCQVMVLTLFIVD